MEQIIPNLYVGGDTDYERIEGRVGFSFLRCCKYGPGGHQQTLGYKTLGAPKGPNYLSAAAQSRLALNFIDVDDHNLIPKEMVLKGIRYIDSRVKAGDKVLVACNKGHSRGPITMMLYLRAIGELPGNFHAGERTFRTLYPEYDPGQGARQFARMHWDEFDGLLRKGDS